MLSSVGIDIQFASLLTIVAETEPNHRVHVIRTPDDVAKLTHVTQSLPLFDCERFTYLTIVGANTPGSKSVIESIRYYASDSADSGACIISLTRAAVKPMCEGDLIELIQLPKNEWEFVVT